MHTLCVGHEKAALWAACGVRGQEITTLENLIAAPFLVKWKYPPRYAVSVAATEVPFVTFLSTICVGVTSIRIEYFSPIVSAAPANEPIFTAPVPGTTLYNCKVPFARIKA
jgi:hypothetical protein